MGKGTIIQAGKSPLGMAVQISGNQKNSLNDPGGGSFRYILPGERLPFLVFVTWGQHFSKMPHTTTGYSLSWGCECLAHLPAWPPDCLPACLSSCCWCGWSWPPYFSLSYLLSLSFSQHPPHSNTCPANRSPSKLPPSTLYQCHNSLKSLLMSWILF